MDPCGPLELETKLPPDGLFVFAAAAAAAATAAIFGANKRIKSGDVDGKPGGIAIGNIQGSTGL
jgi:hypothetical protein